MKRKKEPLIILIGGCAGTGKSTLSKNLSQRLDIIHRQGTGFLREILRAQMNVKKYPFMFGFTFESKPYRNPVEKFKKQSQFMVPATKACIDRAFREGTSLIIEGAHVIPGFIKDKRVSLTVLLYNPDYNCHYRMLHGATHFKRRVSRADFEKNCEIQAWLLKQAKKNRVPVLTCDTQKKMVERVVRLLKKGQK